MDEPLISVIVPVYKVEVYLDKCVSSIVGQTYDTLEIILVDDGSPDSCPAICDAWAKKDRRIKVIHKTNGGLSDARNAGMAVATGEFICFIDSDDWIEPNFFEDLYRAILENGAEIAECAAAYVAEDGTVIRQRKAASQSVLDRKEALRRLILEDGVYQTVWNKLYRREILEGLLFEVGKYNEDDFWTYQVLDRIEKLAIVEKPLYQYLQRGTSIIGVGYNLRRLDGLEARFRRMEYLQKDDELADLTRQQFMLDCMWHLQCALRYLSGQERQIAQNAILALKCQTAKVTQKDLTLNLKYRIWYAMFRFMPVYTAKLRNHLKIGL